MFLSLSLSLCVCVCAACKEWIHRDNQIESVSAQRILFAAPQTHERDTMRKFILHTHIHNHIGLIDTPCIPLEDTVNTWWEFTMSSRGVVTSEEMESFQVCMYIHIYICTCLCVYMYEYTLV